MLLMSFERMPFTILVKKKGEFPEAVMVYSDFSLGSPSLSWELQVTNLSFWNFCFGVPTKHAAHDSATATALRSNGAFLFPVHPYQQACLQTLTKFLEICRKQQLTTYACYSSCIPLLWWKHQYCFHSASRNWPSAVLAWSKKPTDSNRNGQAL